MKKRKVSYWLIALLTMGLLAGCSDTPNEQPTDAGSGTAQQQDEDEQQMNDLDEIEVEFDSDFTDDYKEYAVITATDDSGKILWERETDKYEATELDRVTELGTYEERYYYVEGGTVVALNLSDGSVIWENTEFDGASPEFDYGEDGTLYLCGYYGPDFFAVDSDGNTLKRIQTFDEDYYWACDIICEDDEVIVTLEGGLEETEVDVAVSLQDYSYRLIED